MKRALFFACILIMLLGAAIWSFCSWIEKSMLETNNDIINIVIDPGHGGADGGKTGTIKNEADINLEIALILKDLFNENGFNVIMTRDSGEGLYPQGVSTWDKDEDMKERKKIILNSNSSMLISIHQNSFTDSRVRGAQVFYSDCISENKILAQLIQEKLIVLGEQNDRILVVDNELKILKNNPMPSALVECGFISNQYDEQLLNTRDYQLSVANAVYSAVCEYFGIRP